MPWSRRHVLWAGAAVGGGLIVAAVLPVLRPGARMTPGTRPLGADGWIRIAADGSTRVFTNATEMGQGSWTAIAQLVADELEADWQALSVEMAPVAAEFETDGAYATHGSKTIRRMFDRMRTVGAAARTMLVNAAATRWQVPVHECKARSGTVSHERSGRQAPYGALAELAATLPVPRKPRLKSREDWRLIGQSMPRIEGRAKIEGRASYGIDAQLPELLVAAVAQSPVPDGLLASFDRATASRSPGVVAVVELKDTLAVVGRDYWSAQQGLGVAQPLWRSPPTARTDSSVVLATLEAACRSDAGEALMATPSEREASAALERATHRLEATYVAPFLMHAQIEPMNATARADAARAELWLPTQAQSRMRADVAQALGIDPAAVTIHPTLVGGGFGRRLETDYGVTAALIARKLGRPVKVIWSREQDSLQARLRPAAATRFIGAFDREGRLTYLGSQTACVDREPRVRGLRDIPYGVPFRVVRYSAGEPFGRCGQWRSVDLSQNTFFLESFIDECAAASASDPLDFRRMLLAHDPRSSRVLDTLERLCDWRNARRDGRHLGMAFLQGFDSISAQAVQVEVTPKGGVRVRRVFVVVDCGTAVNPRNVAAQVEGGVLFGLSAALAEEVTIVGGEIQQHNFDAYRLLSMSQSAQVTVEILESPDAPIGGVGELGVPPVAPALANALYAATGNRVRRLPLTRSGSLTA